MIPEYANTLHALNDHPLPTTDTDKISKQGFTGEIDLKKVYVDSRPGGAGINNGLERNSG
jgi:hypothetical protein